jgi:branched-chain amino acid transport system substrate-binding protein
MEDVLMRLRLVVLAAAAMSAIGMGAARAEDGPIRIGSSVGLTGYAATGDRAWRDGLALAVEHANAAGGVLGRKVEVITEDNRSEPQEAVVGYRKMISSDKVVAVDSGCVSAGNAAAAASLARAKIVMSLCSILPARPDEQRWAFSFLPPPRFEIEERLRWLKEHTDIRRVGILYDPTPYALMMKNLTPDIAKAIGIEIVAAETYKQDDADLSVQIGHMNAAGAGAIIKMGQGGSTVTAAKNIRQLGLDRMLLMASLDDGSVFQQAGAIMGENFLFVAPGVQIPSAIPAGPARQAADDFLALWRAKYGDRDPNSAARAWDSFNLLARAMTEAKSTDGEAVRAAFEKQDGVQGAIAQYHFSPEQHVGITENPFYMGTVRNGAFVQK